MMNRIKNFAFAIVLLFGVAGFALASRSPQTGAEYTFDGEPEILAVTFSSAWCSSCKVLEPKLADIVPEFSDRPVKFVKLNFTFGENDEHAQEAENLNILDVYERFKGSTGFTLLIDPETGEIIDMLTMNHSRKMMRAMISSAIAAASRENSNIIE